MAEPGSDGAEGVHVFANGIRLPTRRMLRGQLARYAGAESGNLHEPEEEAWFARLLADAPAEGLFVDVGAALGYYCVLVHRARPRWRLVAMEPQGGMREGLAETLALNGIDAGAVTVDPRALAGTDGQARFSLRRFGSHLLAAADPAVEREARVRTCTLATLARGLGAPVSLMKIDIQGGEAEALEAGAAALSAGAVERLIVGTHGAALHDRVRAVLARDFDILCDDPAPRGQPDGLVVARLR